MRTIVKQNKSRVDPVHLQALRLAALTRDLASCCVAKEAEIFQRCGLSAGEGHVLLAVAAAAEEATPSRVAASLNLGRSRLTPLVQSLVEKGFLLRSESEEDRRVRSLRLTGEGKAVAAEAVNFRLSFHQRLLSLFENGERTHLLEVLTRLHEGMQQVRREYFSDAATAEIHP